jgi:hypothetical protein
LERYLTAIFIGNFLLVLIDATLGYHLVPRLIRPGATDPATVARLTGGMRRLLSCVVALYMFFNCFAYYRGNVVGILVVGGVILLDIGVQLVVRWRLRAK